MHFADGPANKNRMQGNDFVQSLMYRRGVTCFSCHDVHGTANNCRSLHSKTYLSLLILGRTIDYFLIALGRDVESIIRKPRSGSTGKIQVTAS